MKNLNNYGLNIILLLTALLLVSGTASASHCQCHTAGDWNNSTIWNCGRVPGGGDTVTIPAGIRVSVMTNCVVSSIPIVLDIFGELYFPMGKKLTLPAGSKVIIENSGAILTGGGGGTNQLIEIGAEAVYTAGCGCGSCTEDCGNVYGYRVLEGPPVLSLSVTSFNSCVNAGTVSLTWNTADEKDISYFTVEESSDGKNWTELTSLNAGKYTYTYSGICHGRTYYRINENDFNGKPSPVRLISADCESVDFIYDGINKNLRINNALKTEITDLRGNYILNSDAGEIDLSSLENGLYIVTISRAANSEKHKIAVR
jgi:hypothetical protein